MTTERKHRPRRIAADEAHSWARNLRLGNPHAKLVLSMLTLYVDSNGSCFVGIEALSEDTELSADTVRKRLAWLEHIGAIARSAQWIDAAGRRNGERRGKRTSDEIRLLISADHDDIEGLAKGDGGHGPSNETDEISPSPQQGPNNDQDSVSPRLALCQPSDSGKGQDSFEPGTKNQEIDKRAREPLISKEAIKLADDCVVALGFEAQHPPIELAGLAYQVSIMLARGYDPPRIVAAFARFAGQSPVKPLNYFVKVVETACTSPPLVAPENRGNSNATIRNGLVGQTNRHQGGARKSFKEERYAEAFDNACDDLGIPRPDEWGAGNEVGSSAAGWISKPRRP